MSFSVPVTDAFLSRFGGVARLYGMPALEKFSQSHVMVIGLGGVGSWATEALARSGLGQLSLVDLDDLCWTNINRQIHALTDTIGQHKSTALAARVRAINPEISVTEHSCFYSENTAAELLQDPPDLIIDAFDTSKAKVHLIKTCRDLEIPIITSGAAGGRSDPTRVLIDDLSRAHGDSLLNGVRRQLRARYRFPQARKKGGKFGVPAIFSPEQPRYPQPDGSISIKRPPQLSSNSRCDSGYGAITHLTATFGNLAASWALQQLAKP